MTPDREEEPTAGRQALLAALEVPQNLRRSIVVGFVFAVLVTVLFVGILSGGKPTEPAPYYLGLAFVVFVSVAMFSVTVLTVRRALQLAANPANLVRLGGTGGLTAGVAWLLAAFGLAFPGWLPEALLEGAIAWAPILTPVGLWGLYTRDKRTTRLRRLAAVAVLLSLPATFVLADLGALELPVLLGRPGPGTHDVATLYFIGAGLLVGAHVVLGIAVVIGDGPRSFVFVSGFLPLLGFVGLSGFGVGRTGLGLFAAAMALTWLVTGRRLRRVSDDAVPRTAVDYKVSTAGSATDPTDGASASNTADSNSQR